MAAYSVSKSAVIRLTESMSEELKYLGIRANCIVPGTIDTPQNRQDMPQADPQSWVKPESLPVHYLRFGHRSNRICTPVYPML
jgi:NAD(P)-dependent dehydrogenase (short-subunit alcohol dehydrogenase family)